MRLERELQAAGHRQIRWLHTTPEETGASQARLAVGQGASHVVAVGGDGTVRAVAAGLADTGTTLGIVPAGTANLAARNLNLPYRSLRACIQRAAHGRPSPLDLAWVRTEPEAVPDTSHDWARPTLGDEHACLMAAGVGFDADLVASTNPTLKRTIGWGAYVAAAFQNLHGPRMDMVLTLTTTDGEKFIERFQARELLVANGGKLTAGIELLPDAQLDDGLLDVAAIDTVAGMVGWSSLARQILLPTPWNQVSPGWGTGRLQSWRATQMSVRLSQPSLVDIDGELLPPTRFLSVRVQPRAVQVLV